MNKTILLIPLILIWIAVIAGLYQRIAQMPKWFANPRVFWIPLSVLFIITAFVALIINWPSIDTRIHIIGAIVCFGLTGILTPELLQRFRFWLRWTTVRDLLQLVAALFLSIAYNHM
jgi:predicted membrane channel-forming protein YqfA (hemolysin III family)